MSEFDEASVVAWFKSSATGKISNLDIESVIQIARYVHARDAEEIEQLQEQVSDYEGLHQTALNLRSDWLEARREVKKLRTALQTIDQLYMNPEDADAIFYDIRSIAQDALAADEASKNQT